MNDDMDYDTLRALAEEVVKHVTFSALYDTDGQTIIEAVFQMGGGSTSIRTFRFKQSAVGTLPIAIANLKQHLNETAKVAKTRKRTAGAKIKGDKIG